MPLQVEAKPDFWDSTTVLCVTPHCVRLMFRDVKPSAGGQTAGSGARLLSNWHPVSAPVSGSPVGSSMLGAAEKQRSLKSEADAGHSGGSGHGESAPGIQLKETESPEEQGRERAPEGGS